MFESDIVKALQGLVKGEIALERPPDARMGDYAFPCFRLAKEQKRSPADVAKELAKKIAKPDVVEKIEAKGPYVNFFLDKAKVGEGIIAEVLAQKGEFGGAKGDGGVVAIDFSHPNIGKPFHFGHLRSTIIGESIARLLEFQGFSVERLNYLGDWGTQFGALIYAFLEWGDEKKLDDHPVEYLVQLYVKFHGEAEKNPGLKEKAKEWFAKLEQGDEKAVELWGLFKSHSLEEFKRIYGVLGSKFDSWNGEAYVARQVPEAIETMRRKKITEVDRGALIVRLEGYDAPLMLLKDDGSSTYASRDLAALMDRVHNLGAQKVIYVVGHEQSLHFKQLFEVMDKLGHPKENFFHVTFGMYLSAEGGKLSTRKGKVVLMEDVLDEAIGLAKKTIEEKNPELKGKEGVARRVGVAAIVFGDLMNDRIKDVVFDLKRFTSFEGDTGPYLMYTHARAASILRRAKVRELSAGNAALLTDDAEQAVLKKLMDFPVKAGEAAREFKPHVVAQYLIVLARAFNEFYHKCPVTQEKKKDLREARLALVEAARLVLANGLRLLGVEALHEM